MIEIHRDEDAVCPTKEFGMFGTHLFEYGDGRGHSLKEALVSIVCTYVKQKEIVEYLKKGECKGMKLEYNKKSGYWEQKVWSYSNEKWVIYNEFSPHEIHGKNEDETLLEIFEENDLINLIDKYAKDIAFKSWDTRDSCQRNYIKGISYVTKESYSEFFEKCEKDWKKRAKEGLSDEIKMIEMWAWGDVKGFILKKKVRFTKKYEDENREDDNGYELEDVDSCWGYYMETEDLIEEVIKEHDLK